MSTNTKKMVQRIKNAPTLEKALWIGSWDEHQSREVLDALLARVRSEPVTDENADELADLQAEILREIEWSLR